VSGAPDIDRAGEFVWLSARLLDRRRFAHLFGEGDADAVVEALRPYRNPDGGFGNALEPDLRAPVSQPGAVGMAFGVLEELGRLDDPMVANALSYLETIANPDGGVPFVLLSAGNYPRAPWWQAEDDPPSSMLTAFIAAPLHRGGVEGPWLERASEFCWRAIDALNYTSAYDALFAVHFLDHVPDRERAESALGDIGPKLVESGLVAIDPHEPGEIHTPLDFTPRPDLASRRLWSDEVIDRHLDALAARQQPDGGWTFNWQAWAPMVECEWRGAVTLEALTTLRDYGRIKREPASSSPG
jgi:hypothetical protein